MKTNENQFRASQWEVPDSSAAKEKAAHPDQVRDVERVLEALEAQQLDITAEYHVWLHLGFALADAFGEMGREYFHRLSQFYPDYSYRECDKQYTYCLRSRGSGIHLATFFHYAKEAGINISRWEPEYDPSLDDYDPWANFKTDPPVEEAPEVVWVPDEAYADDFIQGSRIGADPVVFPENASSSEEEVDPLEQAWDNWCEARGMSRDRVRLWADKWLRDPEKRKHAEEVLRRLGALKDEGVSSELSGEPEAAAGTSAPDASSTPTEEEERLQEMRRMEMEKWYGQQKPSVPGSAPLSSEATQSKPEDSGEPSSRESQDSMEAAPLPLDPEVEASREEKASSARISHQGAETSGEASFQETQNAVEATLPGSGSFLDSSSRESEDSMEAAPWPSDPGVEASRKEIASLAEISHQGAETSGEASFQETQNAVEATLPGSGSLMNRSSRESEDSGEAFSQEPASSAEVSLQETQASAPTSPQGSLDAETFEGTSNSKEASPEETATPTFPAQDPQDPAPGKASPKEGAGIPSENAFPLSISKEEVSEAPMPTFPEKLYGNLPEFLQRVAAPGDNPQEKDLLLLGCMVAASACFPTVAGYYDGKDVQSNLYLFVAAAASAGKGKLVHCKQLVAPLHWKFREQAEQLKQEYEQELAAYNVSGGEKEGRRKPSKPAERMLFLPANNSTTGLFQLLHDNEGRGLIFETEGDTLAQNLKTDFGNYSDGFRKAFHHETISYYRRTDREYIHIETPCLSTVLSGTPKQVITLIPHAEDGLFSRFLFYFINGQADFREVFARKERGSLDTYYKALGQELLSVHLQLNEQPPLRVELSPDQELRFYTFFRRALKKYRELQPREYDATVMRLGLMSFRLCMLLTIFRMFEEGRAGNKLQCSDRDFQNALSMISVLIRHSSKVFNLLPEEKRLNTKPNLKELFLEKLPAEFGRPDYLQLAQQLKIGKKSAEAYITQFVEKGLLERVEYGKYKNPSALNESSGSGEDENLVVQDA